MRGQKRLALNQRLTSDIHYIIQLFTEPAQSALHEQTRRNLEKVVKGLGARFGLQEVGVHVWGPRLSFDHPEYVIVDTKSPNGPPQGAKLSTMPKAYDPSSVATALLKAGFTGGFQSYPLEPSFISLPTSEPKITPPTQRDAKLPWPVYYHTNTSGFISPVCLTADATPTTLPFTLTLPDPTTIPRIQLLSITQQIPEFRELFSVLFIWAISWKLDELTPRALSFLIIRFMQDLAAGKVIQPYKPKADSDAQHVPLIQPLPSRLVRISCDACLFHSPPKQKNQEDSQDHEFIAKLVKSSIELQIPISLKKTGKLLLLFFRYHQEKHISFYLKMKESIAEADALPRTFSPKQRETTTGLAGPTNKPFRQEPAHWGRRAMVLLDPFFPHLNQAESVSFKTLQFFRAQAASNYRLLSTRNPLSTIFGPHFQPLIQHMHSSSFHTSVSANARPNLAKSPPSYYNEATSSQSIEKQRSRTIQRVQSIIEQRYGPDYKVELFGSVRYGVCSPASDLDMAIVDLKHMDGFPPKISLKSLPAIYNVRSLARVLERAGFRIITVIPFATVPIVKFIDPTTGLHCDINVNEQLGIINSDMIRRYCDLCPPLRSLLIRIKAWAKPIGLNDPSGERGPPTFSSYALTLMTIGFLQSRSLLPNLQDGFEPSKGDTEGVFWIRKRTSRIKCDIRYHRTIQWTSPPMPEVDTLLLEWFKYWATQFDYNNKEMNIRLGGEGIVNRKTPKSKKQQPPATVATNAQEFPGIEDDASASESDQESDSELDSEDDKTSREKGKLVVPDPFILSKNCTKSISKIDLDRFRAECRRGMFFASYGALSDEAFIGSGTTESDDEDIFPKPAKRIRKKRPRMPKDGQTKPVQNTKK